MRILTMIVVAGAGLLSGAGAAALADAADSPAALVQRTAESLLEELKGRREELRQNPDALYALVDEQLLPHFDTSYAGRIAMGKYGRDATPEQRRRFIDAFYRALVRNYADGLLEFTADSLTVLPSRHEEDDADKTKVATEVRLDDGSVVPVDYRMRLTDGRWKVYDVIVEGISYLTNYRKMVTSEAERLGLEAFIVELEQGKVPKVDAK